MGVGSSKDGSGVVVGQPVAIAENTVVDQAALNDALREDNMQEMTTIGVRRDEAQEKGHQLKTQALLKWSQRQPLSAEECAVCFEVVRQFLMSSMALMANHDTMTILLNPAPVEDIKAGMFVYIGMCRMMNHTGPMFSVGAGLRLIDRPLQLDVSQFFQPGFTAAHQISASADKSKRVGVEINEIEGLLSGRAPRLESLIPSSSNGRAFPFGNRRNLTRDGSSLWREARPVIPSQAGPQYLPNSNAMS